MEASNRERAKSTREAPVLAGVILFGVIAIVLGAIQIQRTIHPEREQLSEEALALLFSPEEQDAQMRATLGQLDTDGDGLTDIVEIEQTLTSAYLADSDSDGRTDKEEIDAGEDPNCPFGRNCALAQEEFQEAISSAPNILSGMPEQDNPFQALLGQLNAGPGAAPSATAGQAPGVVDMDTVISQLPSQPNEIRLALIEGGMPREQVGQLSDQQILDVWEQALTALRSSSGL